MYWPMVSAVLAEGIHIHKSHFLLFFASLGFPFAIDGQADAGDGRAFGRVAQFRIARQISRRESLC